MFVMNMMSSSHNDAPPPAAPVTPPQVQEGWVRPPIIYGLAHIAKTGGTTINGELANHFERVCGNKGYSYDAYMTNERFQQTVEKRANDDSKKKNHLVMRADQGDSLTKLWPSFNRGNTPRKWMDEVGYDDCDYVAIETKFIEQWQGVIDQAQTRMEMHVPCRDSLDHLMSQCNHFRNPFSCAEDDATLEATNSSGRHPDSRRK